MNSRAANPQTPFVDVASSFRSVDSIEIVPDKELIADFPVNQI
jgi:hypothetical protein